MAQHQEELIPPRPPFWAVGPLVFFGVVLAAPGVWIIVTRKDMGLGIFLVMFGMFFLSLSCLQPFVRDSWFTAVGRLDRRRRILFLTWNSSFPGLKQFELVHGIYEDGTGGRDRLEFWIDGRKKPVCIDATENWPNAKYEPGWIWWKKAGTRGQWSLKRQGLPASPIQPLSREDLPSDPLAASVDINLVSLGVFLAKQTRRPLYFSQEVVKTPDPAI